jgi:hypothetical protein
MRFTLLTEIYFRHRFFADNCLRDIRVLVPQQTATEMKRYGLLLRIMPDGIRVLCNNSSPPQHRLMNEQLTLVFDLQLQDTSFYNYTSLHQPDVAESVLLFSNREDYTRKKLHKNDVVTADDVVPAAALSGIATKIFGRIVLDITAALQPRYEISFAAKETHWCYFLMSTGLATLSKPAVVDTLANVRFAGPQQIRLPDGKTVPAFISEGLLPLSERPQHTFQLVAATGMDEQYHTVIEVLPVPDVQRISAAGMDVYDPTQDYSEIFLY